MGLPDDDRLVELEKIRAVYAPRANAGDEDAARLVIAVEQMMAETRDWLDRAASRRSESS
jgi:hypothetical protein